MNNITRPTLLLDEQKCRSNIHRMCQRASEHELSFRPHFKTHQSAEIGEWIKEAGVHKCTVSSVKMATYFAGNGWDDILIAFPANALEADNINALSAEIKLQLLLYQAEALELLKQKVEGKVGIKIELDLGSQRSGLMTNQHEEIDELLRSIEDADQFHFTGFYSHPGHTYKSTNADAVRKEYDRIIEQLEMLKAAYGHVLGFSITIGDTPGCTLTEDFGPIEEISPGNFVFYDAMQVNIGSCAWDDIAVVVACPVVGKNENRNELLIHGGAVHFSKEVITDSSGISYFGKLANIGDTGWEGVIDGAYLKSISQEHGLVHCSDELMTNVKIGDLLYIYPAHSCLAADLMKSYQLIGKDPMPDTTAFMRW